MICRRESATGRLMKTVEKHGADWHWSEHDGEIKVEIYVEDLEVIGVVIERPSGNFKSCLYNKVKDPWAESPNWTAVMPESLFDNFEDARNHLSAVLEAPTLT